MRIIGGSLRGRKLLTCRGRATRPTSSRVREAVFNMLQGHLGGARVLDLFAGSGALGIEALSRGAAFAVFVDSLARAREATRDNLTQLEIEAQGEVLGGSADTAIRSFSENGEKFDIIFVDPPYGKAMAEKSLQAISEAGILSDDGLVVAELNKRESLGDRYGSLRLEKSKRYGDTEVSVFSRT